MTTYVEPSSEPLQFGDVCGAPFLADVRVTATSNSLVQLTDPEGRVEGPAIYSVSATPTRLILAAGAPVTGAVVVSDTCAIKTALGRGEQKARRARVWFAPLRDITDDRLRREVTAAPNSFGRFLLNGDARDGVDRVVELRWAFPAEAADVRAALEAADSHFRIHSLADEAGEMLLVRWAAFSSRAGPLVAQGNADRVAELLEPRVGEGVADAAGRSLLRSTAANWRYERGSLENAGALPADGSGDIATAVDEMIEDLTLVRERAAEAVVALTGVRGQL